MAKIRLADALVKILEKEGTKFIFGHPGEQSSLFTRLYKTLP